MSEVALCTQSEPGALVQLWYAQQPFVLLLAAGVGLKVQHPSAARRLSAYSWAIPGRRVAKASPGKPALASGRRPPRHFN